jgi:hypothetical protein
MPLIYFKPALNRSGVRNVFRADRSCFVPQGFDETKPGPHETIFPAGEDIRKRALCIGWLTNDGPKAR